MATKLMDNAKRNKADEFYTHQNRRKIFQIRSIMNNDFLPTPSPEEEAQRAKLRPIRSLFSGLGFSYFLYVFGTQILAAVIIALMPSSVDITSGLGQSITIVLAFYIIGAPLLFLLISKHKGEAPKKQKFGVLDFIVSIFICLAIMTLGGLLGNGVAALFEKMLGYPIENSIEQSLTGPSAWAFAIYSGILAPIGEELIWRKWIIDRTHRHGAVLAIIFSSLFFALMHANIYQFFYALFVGIFFGFVYLKSGRIWITVTLHAILNLLCGVFPAFVLQHLDLDAMEEASKTAEAWAAFLKDNLWAVLGYNVYNIIITGSLFLGVIFFFVFRKRLRLEKSPDELPKNLQAHTAFFNVGTFVFIIGTVGLWLSSIILMSPNFAN